MDTSDKITYESNWLFARFQLDCKSRDKSLLRKFLQLKPARIIDIGAGFGANMIFLSSHMPWDQSWKLVEIREELFVQGIKYMTACLERRGYNVTTDDNSLIARGDNTISIEYVHDSFMRYDYNGDAITCNAFFDIVPLIDARKFFARIGRTPVYSTLNYRMMEIEGGEEWIQLYNLHMKRQGAMGAGVCSDLERINHLQLLVGESVWDVDEPEIIQYLLDYMEHAVPDMISGQDTEKFANWMHHARMKVNVVRVYHCDLLWS